MKFSKRCRVGFLAAVVFDLLVEVVCANVGDMCQSNSRSELKGTVTYQEKMMLPRHADLSITVVDTTDQRESKVIMERVISTEGRQVPIPFEISLPKESISPERSYSAKAAILISGKVWFITKKLVPVLTRGNPCEVKIVLDRSS